jgi:carbon monoxide dehydrogenase subunit G
MSNWFEGAIDIECNIQQVKHALENLGEYHIGVTSLMPGLKSVELVEQGDDFVTIQTNEGLMKRTNISTRIEAENVVVEFDEKYQAGSKITTKSHHLDEFTSSKTGVKHHTVISGVEAPGLLGFLYRSFGKSNIGNAYLNSYKTYFEKVNP